MMKESIFLTFSALALILLVTPAAQTESVRDIKAGDAQVREQMLQITKELGTTCTQCHNVNDFKHPGKAEFGVAAKHMKLVAVMKANGFDGRGGPEANCYMCHRGALKPPAKMPAAP
ncbi:MAG: hypothetical protein KF802_04430 [Bdellovibrionaceae bacterium]|nr:hypothetical protein [Pseudobdellovibrionaceae bacterium]MBX3034203.1 hypothetical protein [Pseudobdellovibrionaceae bacterium]